MQKIIGDFLLGIIAIAFISFCFMLAVFPELIITPWKYQLQNEVRAGEPEAIAYYEKHYISKGIELF